MPDASTVKRNPRREALLCAATRLFAARGYHGTKMDDVALAIRNASRLGT